MMHLQGIRLRIVLQGIQYFIYTVTKINMHITSLLYNTKWLTLITRYSIPTKILINSLSGSRSTDFTLSKGTMAKSPL